MTQFLPLPLTIGLLFHPCLAGDNLPPLESRASFDNIPIELQQMIYYHLTYEDLAQTSRVSKHHHELTQEDCRDRLIYTSPEGLELDLYPSMLLKPFPVFHLKSIVDTIFLHEVSSLTGETLRCLTPFKETGHLTFYAYSEDFRDDERKMVDFSSLGSVLKELPKLESLTFKNLQLTTPNISDFLLAFPCISSLSLSHCEIQRDDLETVLTHVPSSLKELCLTNEMLGSLTIQSYDDWLNIEKIQATPRVVNFICLMSNLRYLTHLQTLDLSHNPLPPSGLYLFVEYLGSLPKKPNWESVRLQSTYISKSSLRDLKKLVDNLPNLTRLTLEKTSFYYNEKGVKALQQLRPSLKLSCDGDD